MKIIIDRFEGNFAVCELENKQMVNVPVAIIPNGAKEGNVISIEIDKEETGKRSKRISNLMNNLFVD